jgi:hypothetical protein
MYILPAGKHFNKYVLVNMTEKYAEWNKGKVTRVKSFAYPRYKLRAAKISASFKFCEIMKNNLMIDEFNGFTSIFNNWLFNV